MSERAYDQFGHRCVLPIAGDAGVEVAGTADALAAIAGTQLPVPFASKLVSGARVVVTGATDAVELMSAVICRSVAGTGTLFAVGTFVYNGTCAAGAYGSAATVSTGTAAEFAARDCVAMSLAIGTTASICTHSFVLGFEELYN